jgi:hypothetical protein
MHYDFGGIKLILDLLGRIPEESVAMMLADHCKFRAQQILMQSKDYPVRSARLDIAAEKAYDAFITASKATGALYDMYSPPPHTYENLAPRRRYVWRMIAVETEQVK